MFRTLETSFWTDPVVRGLPEQAKLLFAYLITNSHTHVSGIYYLPDVVAAHELGIKPGRLNTLWDTLSGVGRVRRDTQTELVWVVNMFRYQGRGEKNEKAAASHLATLHKSPLCKEFLDHYPGVRRFVKDRVSHTPSGAGPKDQEQDKDQERDKKNSAARAATRAAKPQAAGNAEVPEDDPAEFRQLTDFWCDRWAASHGGVEYKFERFDGTVLASLWSLVGFDLERAKRVILTYFSDPTKMYEGHPTNLLKRDLRKFIARAANPNGAAHGAVRKPTAAERGQFPEDDREIPEFGRDKAVASR